jgi:type VI secretion system ImpM family protein
MSVLHRLWTRWGAGPLVQRPAVVSRPLHLFGKLPLSKEFISLGGADLAARELRRWISRGFSQRWATENPGLEIAPHQFLLRLPVSGRSVVGCLWGSGDEAGLRRFPFAVFATLRAGSLGAHPLTALGYVDAFERLGDEIRSGRGPYPNLAAFRRAYWRREVELRLRPPRRMAQALRGAVQGPSLVVEGGPQLDQVVRLRPPAGLSALVQAMLWLAWTEEGSTPGNGPVGFLIPMGCGTAPSTVFFRDVRPDDILLLSGGARRRSPQPPGD